ncbi:MAG TPA: ABC transporter substrate-binding protein [Nocardioides sp.]|jgi:peptide/nickel transport system substrate-binding protein|uniref:ABC transporter substrate-binding protein n=1 Tax=Nocardioides sp. TaxID=35761 RepID=UPI002E30F824|nr:ABC transporter substrate-binding protein [Nocardioides sp.]HEX3930912.1 ABC transporter substrate-binding protein [Nocardioides sp.]
MWVTPRYPAAAAAAAAILLTVTACGGSSPSTSPTGGPAGSSSATGDAAGHTGGTLHLVAQSAGGTLDPQVNYTLQYWQLYQATYDQLITYARVGGSQSVDLVPDLATAMPKVSDGGKTYAFTLRQGIRFSNGKPVTTADVVASFRRIFKVASPNAGSWYNVLVGADACLKTPATCTLDGGVVADAKTGRITFHLTQADPQFEAQLAMPFASILPASAPSKDAGTTPIPTTGPYYFSSYSPNSALTMKRNPYFKQWSAQAEPAGYPDEIEETFGLTAESEVTAVENNQADWMYDAPPSDRLVEISSKYSDRAHVNPLTAMWYLTLNSNIPPFNNVKARQAINWAVDRAAVVRLYGGTSLAQPACTILPPGFPGHRDFCNYTAGGGTTWTAPDLDKAKALVQASGTAGQQVGVVVQNDSVNKSIGSYLTSLLNQLGYKATLKPLSNNIQFTYIQNTDNHVQLALTQWYQDYPAAADFLQVLLSCASFHPHSDSSINIAGYCNHSLDAKMDAANTLGVTSPSAANTQWGTIDEDYMKESPLVPLITPKLVDFTSSRVGHYQFSLQYYMLVDQLWVQ